MRHWMPTAGLSSASPTFCGAHRGMHSARLGWTRTNVHTRSLPRVHFGGSATTPSTRQRNPCSLSRLRSSARTFGTLLLQQARSATVSDRICACVSWNGYRLLERLETMVYRSIQRPSAIASPKPPAKTRARSRFSSVIRLGALLQPYSAPWHLTPSAVLYCLVLRYASGRQRAVSGMRWFPWCRWAWAKLSRVRARFCLISAPSHLPTRSYGRG
jgi:hypothetical protein